MHLIIIVNFNQFDVYWSICVTVITVLPIYQVYLYTLMSNPVKYYILLDCIILKGTVLLVSSPPYVYKSSPSIVLVAKWNTYKCSINLCIINTWHWFSRLCCTKYWICSGEIQCAALDLRTCGQGLGWSGIKTPTHSIPLATATQCQFRQDTHI